MSIKKVLQNDFHAFVAWVLGIETEAVPYILAVVNQFKSVGWTQLLSIAASAEAPIAAAILSGGNIGAVISSVAASAEAKIIADATTDGKNAVYTLLGMVQAKTSQAQADAATPIATPAA